MSSPTFFLQECPTCGRRLHVRVVYLGRDLTCPHCSGRFVANDPALSRTAPTETKSLLQKADELLAAASRIKSA